VKDSSAVSVLKMFGQNIASNAKLEIRDQGYKSAQWKVLMMYHQVECFRTESLQRLYIERSRIY
jgi:hypothetical protein